MTRRLALQSVSLLFLAFVLGALRQLAPNGISWRGDWPSSTTGAEEAYRMVAKPGDPPFVSLAEAMKFQKEKKAVFLDARTKELFAAGHIPEARNIPFYELEAFQDKALAETQEDTPLVIYCEGIGCELSFFLGRELTQAGYKQVYIFYGGYPEWEKAGLPIEK